MKKVIKRIFGVLCFLLVILTVTLNINNILRWKDGTAITRVYKMKRNTIDVATYGSSHDFCTINPVLFWQKFGIATASLSESGQTLDSTIVYIKESLKYQKPKLIIVEGYYLTSIGGKPNVNNGNLYRNTLNLRYSDNYCENVEATIDEESVAPANVKDFRKWLLLKFPVYHSRYNEITKDDFTKFDISDCGFNIAYTVDDYSEPEACKIADEADISDKQKAYVDEIAKIAKEGGANLLIYIAPYALPDIHMKVYNSFEKYCDEVGIPFINFNKKEYLTESGFDFSKDLRFENGASGHLNYTGAEKITNYLCEYIHKNYNLEDRRGNVDYSIYDKQADYLDFELNNHEICECDRFDRYIELVCNDKIDYALVVNNNADEIINALKDILKEKNISREEDIEYLADGVYSTVKCTDERAYILSDSVVVECLKEQDNKGIYIDKKYQKCLDADIAVVSVNKSTGELIDMSKFKYEDGEFSKIINE